MTERTLLPGRGPSGAASLKSPPGSQTLGNMQQRQGDSFYMSELLSYSLDRLRKVSAGRSQQRERQ